MASAKVPPVFNFDVKQYVAAQAGRNADTYSPRSRVGVALRVVLAFTCFAILALRIYWQHERTPRLIMPELKEMADICPQMQHIVPALSSTLLEELEAKFATEEFRLHAYGSLGGAIQIPTQIYDDMGVPGEDPQWDIFTEMHDYLETRFPLVHAKLAKATANTYALIYHWQGSDNTLKPMLLTAHQDVVPVEPSMADQWIQPPFSGFYDGEWIWGRGSCDDKPGLISTLTTVETLLSKGFQPTRSIVLAYGMDEERGGRAGATAIRDYLLDHYGEDAFSIIVDEGGGYSTRGAAIMSTPAVAEKGKLDAKVQISTPGGHSSVPPPHTSIGILAALIKHVEANPHVPHLNRSSTYYAQLQCQAQHDPIFPTKLKKLVKMSRHCDKALAVLEKELQNSDPMFGPLSGTTQAVDIIHGGVKSNALPENVHFIMNHRIDSVSSVGAVKTHIAKTVGPMANSYNLSVDAFGEQYGKLKKGVAFGHLEMTDAYGTQLEPAPVSPTFGSGPYELLAGTVISALNTSNRTGVPKSVFLAPGLSTGNTDTRHYWKLTKHIFRYGHVAREDHYNGAHTVNEACRAEGFLEVIRFHTRLILNGHDSPLLE